MENGMGSGKILLQILCSKKIDDSMNGFNPGNSKKIFDECLNDLEKRGMVKV